MPTAKDQGELFALVRSTHLKNCHLIVELHDSPGMAISAFDPKLPLLCTQSFCFLITSYTDSYKAHYYQCDEIGTDPIERFVAFLRNAPGKWIGSVCEPVTSQA